MQNALPTGHSKPPNHPLLQPLLSPHGPVVDAMNDDLGVTAGLRGPC